MGLKEVSVSFDTTVAGGVAPGSTLSGHVKLTTRKPTTVRDVTVSFEGKAKVGFYSHHEDWFKRGSVEGCNDGLGPALTVQWNSIKRRRRHSDSQHFRGVQPFVNFSYPLLDDTRLELGTFDFPFSFNLPNGLPSSFSSRPGSIRYKIKVKWKCSGILSGDKYKVEVPVVKSKHFDSMAAHSPLLFKPVTHRINKAFKFLFMSSHPVTLEVKMNSTAVMSGGTLSADIFVDNASSIAIEAIVVKFIQRTACVGKHGYMRSVKMEDTVLKETKYPGVSILSSRSFNIQIPVFTKPLPDLEPCTIIKNVHLLIVTAVASGMYNERRVIAPVEVCSSSGSTSVSKPVYYKGAACSDDGAQSSVASYGASSSVPCTAGFASAPPYTLPSAPVSSTSPYPLSSSVPYTGTQPSAPVSSTAPRHSDPSSPPRYGFNVDPPDYDDPPPPYPGLPKT